MGSTLVAACVRASRLVYAGVGDSRLYLFRGGSLRQLSTDDSWAASMIRSGARPEVVKAHPMRHLLTSALGTEGRLKVSLGADTLNDGDTLLLCTDGLHGAVSDDEMAAILAGGGGSLDQAAGRLIDAANDAGGPDNVTVVLGPPSRGPRRGGGMTRRRPACGAWADPASPAAGPRPARAGGHRVRRPGRRARDHGPAGVRHPGARPEDVRARRGPEREDDRAISGQEPGRGRLFGAGRGRSRSERGQALSEYVVMMGFIVATVIAAMALFVGPVAGRWCGWRGGSWWVSRARRNAGGERQTGRTTC